MNTSLYSNIHNILTILPVGKIIPQCQRKVLCVFLKKIRIVVTCRGTIDDFKAKTCLEISLTTCVNRRWGDLLALISTFPTKRNSFCLNDRQRTDYFLFYHLFSMQRSGLIFKASTLYKLINLSIDLMVHYDMDHNVYDNFYAKESYQSLYFISTTLGV